ncbi:MAG: DUF4954 family protein [Sphaerochaetaceae bacterium]
MTTGLLSEYGYRFIAQEDEYWSRNAQIEHWQANFRSLSAKEREQLALQGNTSANWDDVLIEDPCDLSLIRNNSFYGLVRIGSLEPRTLGHHDFILPQGISNSHIISSDIGRHCAIHRVGYLTHYIIESDSILSEIDEMGTTNHSKFGNGIVKEGEDESVRIWIGIINETEGRKILPFATMNCADAYLWGIYRDRPQFLQKLIEFTNAEVTKRRGVYGVVGQGSVIKSCRIIKDVNFGPASYVKGANKLKNLTIRSHASSPSQIGEGVEMVNGIIGYGCRVFYGVKAVRFVMGSNSNLKYGARLINSVLGDNSTVSCCEVLNTLTFPFHEQHHNNSFLIASLIQGQSNMAAGANIGSNHNTRGNDGEMHAKRGFWPALSSSVKFNSSFASFSLLAKGSYPNELNIPLPFSLISYCEEKGRLTIMPAYWWMYNRFALERNEWKFRDRDKRVFVSQNIETEYIAPDTLAEILQAMEKLCEWVGHSALQASLISSASAATEKQIIHSGKMLLEQQPQIVASLSVEATGLERSNKPAVILKAVEAYRSYKEMIIYGSVRIVLGYLEQNTLSIVEFQQWVLPYLILHANQKALVGSPFVNLGGQIVPESEVLTLLEEIEQGKVDSWDQVHQRYESWWASYGELKAATAFQALLRVLEIEALDKVSWDNVLNDFVILCDQGAQEVYRSRQKDFADPFRKIVYRNDAEMEAVLGRIEENSFIKQTNAETARLKELAARFSPWL